MKRKETQVWPGYVMVGEVTSPFGIDGSVRVYPTTDFPERLLQLQKVTVDRLKGERAVIASRLAPPMAIVKLAGFETREQVEVLRGAILMVPQENLAKLPEGEYYWHQLVGLQVVEVNSERVLGSLTHVLRTGAGHDVFEVEREGKKPLLIPSLKSIVKKVDLTLGQMIVELLPGLEDMAD